MHYIFLLDFSFRWKMKWVGLGKQGNKDWKGKYTKIGSLILLCSDLSLVLYICFCGRRNKHLFHCVCMSDREMVMYLLLGLSHDFLRLLWCWVANPMPLSQICMLAYTTRKLSTYSYRASWVKALFSFSRHWIEFILLIWSLNLTKVGIWEYVD